MWYEFVLPVKTQLYTHVHKPDTIMKINITLHFDQIDTFILNIFFIAHFLRSIFFDFYRSIISWLKKYSSFFIIKAERRFCLSTLHIIYQTSMCLNTLHLALAISPEISPEYGSSLSPYLLLVRSWRTTIIMAIISSSISFGRLA